MYKMFCGCLSLITLNKLIYQNTEKSIEISYIFKGCSSLVSLPDISKWNAEHCIDMSYFFIIVHN